MDHVFGEVQLPGIQSVDGRGLRAGLVGSLTCFQGADFEVTSLLRISTLVLLICWPHRKGCSDVWRRVADREKIVAVRLGKRQVSRCIFSVTQVTCGFRNLVI